MPSPGPNIRLFHDVPPPAMQLIPTMPSAREPLLVGSERGDLARASRARRTRAARRCRRARPAARTSTPSAASNSSARSYGVTVGMRLLHPAEADARALALEPHGHGAAPRLEPDLDELQRRREHEGGAERRMARERQLERRREDPHLHVAVGLGRIHEHRLREVQLPRERLEVSSGISRASVKTASWLPLNGVSVKTSTTT